MARNAEESKPAERPKENRCFNCKHDLEPDAKYCTQCKMYQHGARRFLSDWDHAIKVTSALLGLVGTIAAGFLFLQKCFGSSQTNVKFASAYAREIHVNAVNEGVRAAYFRGASLSFGELPIESRELVVVEADRPVIKGGLLAQEGTAIALRAPGFRPQKKPGSDLRFTHGEIKELLEGRDYPLTLSVSIEESNGRVRTRAIPLRSSAVQEFILEGIPEQEEEP